MFNDSLGEYWKEQVREAVAAERKRCAEIVKAARFGEIDQDFRSIINMIEDGGYVADLLNDSNL